MCENYNSQLQKVKTKRQVINYFKETLALPQVIMNMMQLSESDCVIHRDNEIITISFSNSNGLILLIKMCPNKLASVSTYVISKCKDSIEMALDAGRDLLAVVINDNDLQIADYRKEQM